MVAAVPRRIEDCRAEVVHTVRVGIRLGLCPERWEVQNNASNVVQHVSASIRYGSPNMMTSMGPAGSQVG